MFLPFFEWCTLSAAPSGAGLSATAVTATFVSAGAMAVQLLDDDPELSISAKRRSMGDFVSLDRSNNVATCCSCLRKWMITVSQGTVIDPGFGSAAVTAPLPGCNGCVQGAFSAAGGRSAQLAGVAAKVSEETSGTFNRSPVR